MFNNRLSHSNEKDLQLKLIKLHFQ